MTSRERIRRRFMRAWLRKHGEMSRGRVSRLNLDGMGDDHYVWERRLPSRGWSSWSKASAAIRFADLMAARHVQSAARFEQRRLSNMKRNARRGSGVFMHHGGYQYSHTAASAAKVRRSLDARIARYDRMWAVRRRSA